jgi:MerR family transcriptional regulator, redox-sensitive transcriptional activator SoxR
MDAEMQVQLATSTLDGFSGDTLPSERWRVLAREKLPEVEALVERALSMKDILERGLRCECLRLEDCELVERSPRFSRE